MYKIIIKVENKKIAKDTHKESILCSVGASTV